MSVLYVTEQGACIAKRGERVVVEKEGKELAELHCETLDTVLIFGNVQITTQAVRQMLKHGIEMALLTMSGELLGHLTPATPKNVFLRIAQVKAVEDERFVVTTAKSIVEAKISNGLVLLQEFLRNHPEADLADVIGSLRRSVESVPSAESRESLVGVEGNAGAVYWSGFAKMCSGDFAFAKRVKRPPTDPVNSLLSFGYSLVFARLQGLLDGVGLDPYIGCFHDLHYGRASLAADLLEEFRAPLVDRFTLTLVNKRVMKPDDFEAHEESGGIRMTREGMKGYLGKFEEYLGKKLAGSDDPALDFLGLFKRQVERMAKAVADRGPYCPFRVRLT